jgi:hypothetical protein
LFLEFLYVLFNLLEHLTDLKLIIWEIIDEYSSFGTSTLINCFILIVATFLLIIVLVYVVFEFTIIYEFIFIVFSLARLASPPRCLPLLCDNLPFRASSRRSYLPVGLFLATRTSDSILRLFIFICKILIIGLVHNLLILSIKKLIILILNNPLLTTAAYKSVPFHRQELVLILLIVLINEIVTSPLNLTIIE